MSKKRKKKRRLQMQSRPRPKVDVSVEPVGDNPQAQRMLANAQAILEWGTYPCPECGTLLQPAGGDLVAGLRFHCPNPDCHYEAEWGSWGSF